MQKLTKNALKLLGVLLICGGVSSCATKKPIPKIQVSVCLYSTKSKSFQCSNGNNSWNLPEGLANNYVAYPPEDHAVLMSGCLLSKE